MSKEQFELAQLISKYLQGTLSTEEEADLLARSEQDGQIKQLLSHFTDSDALSEDIAFMEGLDQEADWEAVLKKHAIAHPNKKSSRRFKGNWFSIAAAFVLLCGLAWWRLHDAPQDGIIQDQRYGYKNDVLPGTNKAILTLSTGQKLSLGADSLTFRDGETLLGNKVMSSNEEDNQSSAHVWNTVSVPKGGSYQLRLPDGSSVWLNAETVLTFPSRFDDRERAIHLLDGEAYFEVVPQTSAPFIVYTDHLNVEALGTAFNINVYTGQAAKSILTEGKIKVSSGDDQQILTPGYAVTSTDGKLSVQKADMEEALSWKDGYFYFNGKNLYQILEDVGRWYDVEVSYTVDVSKKRYKGGIKKSATLGGICQMLTNLSGYKFKIEGRKLIVT